MIKEKVTRFNLEDAFKELDAINYSNKDKVESHKTRFKEDFKIIEPSQSLIEEYYNISNNADLEEANDERKAEIAKAKLARIEKIVDLDAETPEDIQPSYAGKIIIQCPQCMTLFYKDEADIVKSENDESTCNVGEKCQHCGNDTGYTIIGKVAPITAEEADNYETAEEMTTDELAEETPVEEEKPEEELTTEEQTEETTSEEELPKVDLENNEKEEEKSDEDDNDKKELKEDILVDVQLKDEPDVNIEDLKDREEELIVKTDGLPKESKTHVIVRDVEELEDPDNAATFTPQETIDVAVKAAQEITGDKLSDEDIEKVSDIIDNIVDEKVDEKENLTEEIFEELDVDELKEEVIVKTKTLKEDADLDKKLKEHNEYISVLQDEIKKEEEAIKSAKNEFIKKMHEDNLASLQTALDKAIPEEVKSEVKSEATDLPEPEEIDVDIENKEDLKEEVLSPALVDTLGMQIDEASALDELDEVEHAVETAHKDEDITDEEYNALYSELVNKRKELKKEDKEVKEEVCPECGKNPCECDNKKELTESIRDRIKNITDKWGLLSEDADKLEEANSISDDEIAELLNSKEFNTPISNKEVKGLINKLTEKCDFKNLEEIDEVCLEKCINKSLMEVYSNVKEFKINECSMKDSKLIIEGLITFKSGNTKNTKYIFTEDKNNKNLTGLNETLDKDGIFKLNYSIKNKKLFAESLQYSYHINDNLVEGLVNIK